jgi:hypothetical protein
VVKVETVALRLQQQRLEEHLQQLQQQQQLTLKQILM